MPAETSAAPAADLLGLFPPGSRVDPDGELVVGGCRLTDLAAAWGTPLYVVAEAAVRDQVRRFRRALDANVAAIYAIAAQHDASTLLAKGMPSVFVA